ncbi:chromatin target of PRMT1 protein-like isoform X2 [Sander lucioperca]|nr:chromatin target of PRMT1 protein-like isoform X2 [Sander lucioperca]
MTFDPVLLQQRGGSNPKRAVMWPKKLPRNLQTHGPFAGLKQRLRRRRRSVWTRLGGPLLTRRLSTGRLRGFWSFTNKYRWRRRFTSTYRGRRNLHSRLGQRPLLRKRNIQKLTAGSTNLQRGGATASRGRGRGQSKCHVPTRKQLDAQLDEYMSMSKSRLDKQLDDYMSMSKSRLDAQLDEYMSMAGQTPWDC